MKSIQTRIIFIYWLAAPSSQTMVIPVTAVSVRNVYILDRVSQSDNSNDPASHNCVISVPQQRYSVLTPQSTSQFPPAMTLPVNKQIPLWKLHRKG